MDKNIIAYIAGVLDGEGNIGISKKVANGKLYYYLFVRVVCNTDKKLVDFISKYLNKPSTVFKQSKRNKKYKDMYSVVLYSREAFVFLKMIHPYLIVKNRRAELALDFYNNRSDVSLNRSYYASMKCLNSRGRGNLTDIDNDRICNITDAYLAGILDGEGSIGIYKVNQKYYTVKVDVVSNTNLSLINSVSNYLDKKPYSNNNSKNDRHKECYVVRLYSVKAQELLYRLMPYLISKKPQASLAIKLQELNNLSDNKNHAAKEDLYIHAKLLNRRGYHE